MLQGSFIEEILMKIMSLYLRLYTVCIHLTMCECTMCIIGGSTRANRPINAGAGCRGWRVLLVELSGTNHGVIEHGRFTGAL